MFIQFSFTVKGKRRAAWLAGMAVAVCMAGCESRQDDPALPTPPLPPRPRPVVPSPVRLSDVTATAGLRFRHNNGAFGLKLYPETLGSGAAFIDYDGDGDQDIFLVNGRDWTNAEVDAYRRGPGRSHRKYYGFVLPSPRPRRRTTGALFRNNGDGTFSDVTQGSGLGLEMLGMGAAVGDYDNDGRPDLYVTAYGRNYLLHNESPRPGRAARFREVAGAAGVRDGGYSTSAAWLDYDHDGRLDLFVCRYIEWRPAIDVWDFGSAKKINGGYLKSYSGPVFYDGEASHLYRNVGRGRFVDVSRQAGLYAPVPALTAREAPSVRPPNARVRLTADLSAHQTLAQTKAALAVPTKQQGKSLGVAVGDFNNDGWPDILVANDTVRNYLFQNQKDGTFTEVGVKTGIAYGPSGQKRAGMGVDIGDIDHSGRDSVVVGNFSYECLGLYHNEAGGLFNEIAGVAGVVGASRLFLTFGCAFLDIDNDGWLDILAANGHVYDTVANMQRAQGYAQRPLLFVNRGRRPVQFDEVGLQSGAALGKPVVGRGLAYADIDLDGDLDVLLTTNGGPPVLLRNDPLPAARHHNVLRLTLEGTRSNRSAIGAVVEATLPEPGRAGRMRLRRLVKSGSSYLSQSELPLTLGLGSATDVESLTIQWPSGQRTQLRHLAAHQMLTVREGSGIVRRQALRR